MLNKDEAPSELEVARAQLQKLELEIKKLTHDVQILGSKTYKLESIIKFIPVITTVIAIAAFWFSVRQYNAQQATAAFNLHEETKKALITPLWDQRLTYYFAATEAAAIIATSKDEDERRKAEAKFNQLYYGPLVLVEDSNVEAAMVHFHLCLTGQDACNEDGLQIRSLKLAGSARASIEEAFGVKLGVLALKQ